MYISKSKSYTTLPPLSELKEDLRIASNDNSYDGEITRLMKSAVSAIEKRVQGDIVPTANSLEDYCFYGSCYQINEPNISISAITVTSNILTSPTIYSITGYSLQKHNQYTLIRFKNYVQAEQINISYSSGYAAIPDDLKRSIIMLMAQMFDVDKNGYVQNITETKAIDRLIAPYINTIY